MSFFETSEPYQIADNITSENELSPDLVAHVFVLMHNREGIEDKAAFFARVAHQQWNWYNSEFNRLYRPNGMVQLNEDILYEDSDVIHSDGYKKHFREYFNKVLNTPEEWYCREIAYFWIYDKMTYREIAAETNINIRYITEAIKQFKDDVYNSYYSHSDCDDTDIV